MSVVPFLLALAIGAVDDGELAQLEARAARASTAEVRLEALRAIAALQPEEGPPREEVTRALAAGLRDESASNRRETAALLGVGQHPIAALLALTEAAGAAHSRWDAAWRELEERGAEGAKMLDELFRLSEKDPLAAQRRIEEFNARIGELRAAVELARVDRDAFAAPLAGFPDDRAIGALVEIVEHSRLQPGVLAPVDALLALGSGRGLDAVVGELDRCEERARELRVELERLEREESRAARRGDAEKAERSEKSQEIQRRQLDNVAAYSQEIAGRLRTHAEERSLPAPPGALATARDWNRWRVGARAMLPSSLGRIEVPNAEDGE